jgi:hypothetical protein
VRTWQLGADSDCQRISCIPCTRHTHHKKTRFGLTFWNSTFLHSAVELNTRYELVDSIPYLSMTQCWHMGGEQTKTLRNLDFGIWCEWSPSHFGCFKSEVKRLILLFNNSPWLDVAIVVARKISITIKRHEIGCQNHSELIHLRTTIFHTWYCSDCVVCIGKVDILAPANVILNRFGNKVSTTKVAPWKQTSGTEICDSWDADV